MKQTRKAFTMIELIFVMVVLGILSSIAISRLAVTRDDAIMTKGRSDVAAIRNAIALAKSIQMMEGNATLYPTTLDDGSGTKLFDISGNGIKLLDYPIYAKDADGHWKKSGSYYIYKVMKTDVKFAYNSSNGTFDCHGQNIGIADTYCRKLTE